MQAKRLASTNLHELIFGEDYAFKIAVGKNLGVLRSCVACSNAYANLRSVGSCHALAMKERPTGKPNMNPAGTVICGYPATAAGEVLSISQLMASPLTRSIIQDGPPEGTTIASSLYLRIVASSPLVRAYKWFFAKASRYFLSLRDGFSKAVIICS